MLECRRGGLACSITKIRWGSSTSAPKLSPCARARAVMRSRHMRTTQRILLRTERVEFICSICCSALRHISVLRHLH